MEEWKQVINKDQTQRDGHFSSACCTDLHKQVQTQRDGHFSSACCTDPHKQVQTQRDGHFSSACCTETSTNRLKVRTHGLLAKSLSSLTTVGLASTGIIIIIITIIKRISRAPIYRTRWEHRALYNNTNDTHTHPRMHPHTHIHTHTCMHTHALDEGIRRAVKNSLEIIIKLVRLEVESE